MAWSNHATLNGCNTQWTSWLAFLECMVWRPTSQSHSQWHTSPDNYKQGCRRRPWRWSARGWETRTKWDSKVRYHARSVVWNSPRGPWRHTAVACTLPSLQSTGVGCRSDRQYTNPRCKTWAFCGRKIIALVPSPDDRYPPARVTAYALTSTGITGRIG